MMFLMLGAVLFLLPILLRLALKLWLGIPMLYAVLMLTVFLDWYRANTALADGIFFVLIGLIALSWVVALPRPASQSRWRERHPHRRPLIIVTPVPAAPG